MTATNQQVNIEAVRFKALQVAPYFGTVIWSLQYVATPGIGTFAVTDTGQFLYDPDVPWSFPEQVGVFIHELHHVILNHAERAGTKDPATWNEATDIAINDSLRRWGILLPDGALQPELYSLEPNQAAESYYGVLVKRKQEQHKKQSGSGDSNQQGQQQGGGSDKDSKLPPKPDGCSPTKGRCGSGAGIRESFEPPPGSGPPGSPTQGQGNTNKPGNEKSGVEIEAMRKRVAEDVVKNIGDAPGMLVDWAKSVLNPKRSWQSVLRSAVKRAVQNIAGGASDYTFSKVNYRSIDPDIILPSLVTKKPEVCVIVDTSGSISTEELNEALSEVSGVMRAHANRMTILAVDRKVHEQHTVSLASRLNELKFTGGGGTDMRVGIKHALKLTPKANIIIIFTDGESPWPDQKPDAEVVVCLNKYGSARRVPSWARLIKLGDN